MSGGHFDYVGARIRDGLEEIANNEEVQTRFPQLAIRLRDLASVLYDLEHDLDWDLSGDTGIENDAEFEAHALAWLGDVEP